MWVVLPSPSRRSNLCVSLGLAPEKGAWADPFHPLWHFPGKAAILFQQNSLSDYTEPVGKLKQAPWGSKMHPSECGLRCGERFWSLLGEGVGHLGMTWSAPSIRRVNCRNKSHSPLLPRGGVRQLCLLMEEAWSRPLTNHFPSLSVPPPPTDNCQGMWSRTFVGFCEPFIAA